MLKNYCKVALRNLRRHSFYTTLNIFGLSLGIACGMVLFQFIQYHLGFDGYHSKAGRIHRVVTDIHLDDGSVFNEKGAPLALAGALKAQTPQVTDQAFLFSNYRNHTFTMAVPQPGNATGKLFAEHENIAFTDKHWFSLFDYQWEAGNPGSALEEPNTAVLTRRQAAKYFGSEDPIGKIIRVDGKQDVRVTGILKDYPPNAGTKVDVFLSLTSIRGIFPAIGPEIQTEWGWINSSNSLYLLLPEGLSPAVVDKAIKAVTKAHMGDMAKYYDFHTQPLKEVHFDMRYGGTITRSLLTTLGIIGLFILIIACVNFINLATAQSTRRAREIGTRKVLGSTAAAIFWQFITETTFITTFAVVLAFGWSWLAMSAMNDWLHINLELDPLRDRQLMTALLSLMVFVILGAGCYPALLLSRFKPLDVLKSRGGKAGRPWLRKGLILLQNLVAQSLIICTLIITWQINYVKNADLGFNKSAVVMVSLPTQTKSTLAYLRNRLAALPDIKNTSFCFQAPAAQSFKSGSVKFDNRDWEQYSVRSIVGDAHYASTFGLQLIAGRNFMESDTVREFLVSEDFAKKLGFTDVSRVIGHRLVAGAINDRSGTIVGVVKDLHASSLHAAIDPLLITTNLEDYTYAGIKINGAHPGQSIREIQGIWQSVYPDKIFSYRWLDQQIADFYQKEDLLNKLIMTFATLAIVISCVGLLGLISLMTAQRTREIGIRKVIGATVSNITLLLSKDLIKLVGIALVLASIVAWVVMSSWLQGFAYRITIPWWIFLLAGIGNMAMALLTIGYHAIKAAFVNPVNSLRSE